MKVSLQEFLKNDVVSQEEHAEALADVVIVPSHDDDDVSEVVDETIVVSEEGFMGGLLGFLVGGVTWNPLLGPAVHTTAKATRLKLREDIETIAKRIEKVRQGDLEEAKKKGLELPKKLKNQDWTEIVKSGLLGTFFGPIYGARQGNQLENLNKELQKKLKELEKEIKEAGISTEGYDNIGGDGETLVYLSLEEIEETLTDGVTTIDEIEAPDASVDEVVAEMVDSKLTSDEIQRDTEVLVEAQESMEAYHNFLLETMDSGGINSHSAQFMRMGLERYEALFGMDTPLTPSVEAFGGSMSQRQATTVSVETIGEWLKGIWERLKKALKMLWEMLKDTFAKITLGVKALDMRVKSLEKRVGKAGNLKADGVTIEIKNPSKLMANGTWLGNTDGIQVLAGIVGYIADTYPTAVSNIGLKLAENLKYLAANIDKVGEDSNTRVDALVKEVQSFVKGFPSERQDDDQLGTTYLTGVLFDNKQIALHLNMDVDELRGTVTEGSNRPLRGMTVDVQSALAKESQDSFSVPVLPVTELRSQISALAKVIDLLNKLPQKQRDAKRTIDQLTQAGDAVKAKADKADLTEAQRTAISQELGSVMVVQRLLGVSYSGILAYCVRTINAQLSVIDRQLSTYTLEKE